jgi:hypothetical protein
VEGYRNAQCCVGSANATQEYWQHLPIHACSLLQPAKTTARLRSIISTPSSPNRRPAASLQQYLHNHSSQVLAEGAALLAQRKRHNSNWLAPLTL